MADLFFQDGNPRVNADQYPGIDYIARTLHVAETKADVWIVMEFGGKSLSKASTASCSGLALGWNRFVGCKTS